MPKPIARSKTKSRGQAIQNHWHGQDLRAHASRRHLLASKSAKRKRHLAKSALVHPTDMARIIKNLPFSH